MIRAMIVLLALFATAPTWADGMTPFFNGVLKKLTITNANNPGHPFILQADNYDDLGIFYDGSERIEFGQGGDIYAGFIHDIDDTMKWGYSNANSAFVIDNPSGTVLWSIDATGHATFTKPPASSYACDSGYTRSGDNYCLHTTGTSTGLTAGACTAITVTSVSKYVDIGVQLTVAANNSAGQLRYATVLPYPTNVCGTPQGYGAVLEATEVAATTAGTALVVGNQRIRAATDANGKAYIVFTRDGGNQGAASYYVIGYGE